MNERQEALDVERITLAQPKASVDLFLLILFYRYSLIDLWNSGNWILRLAKDLSVDRIVVGLVFLGVHYTLSSELCKVPELASVSARKPSFVVHLGRPSEVSPRSERNLFLGTKLSLEKVSNAIFSELVPIGLCTDVNDRDIINLECLYVLFKTFKAFDLINLWQIHVVFDHVVPTFEHILLTCVIVNLLHNRLPRPVHFDFCHNVLRLVLL